MLFLLLPVLLLCSNILACPHPTIAPDTPDIDQNVVHLSLPNKNYYLGIYFKANYFTASEFCRYHGMRLATINSQEENDQLITYMNLMGIGTEHVWLSGSDLGHEGRFIWMSSGEPLTFYNFMSNQPDNAAGKEHCLEIRTAGKWNDLPCEVQQYFVCEF